MLKLKSAGTFPSGSEYFETGCRTFRLVRSDTCYGVSMPVEYKVWQWIRGGWTLRKETRSLKAAKKFIEHELERLDEEE